MTSRKFQTLALCALFLGLAVLTAAGSADARPRRFPVGGRWELLGERTVSDRIDHDVLPVTAARGTFRSLKLEVRGHAVQFHRMVIHFGDGERQEVELRNVIPAGGESRAIAVEGRERVIRSIEFTYDAQTLRGRSARVLVYGRG